MGSRVGVKGVGVGGGSRGGRVKQWWGQRVVGSRGSSVVGVNGVVEV